MKPKTTNLTHDTQPLPGIGFTVITVYPKVEDWATIKSAEKHNQLPRSITTRRVRLCNFTATMPGRVATTKFTLAIDYHQTVYEARTGIMLFDMGDYLSSPALDKARKPEHTVRMVAAAFELYLLNYTEDRFNHPINYYVLTSRYFRAYNTANNLSASLPNEIWQVRVVMEVDGDVVKAAKFDGYCGSDRIKILRDTEDTFAWWALYQMDDNGLFQWKADTTTLDSMKLVWVAHTMTSPDVIRDICSQDISLQPHVIRGEG